MKTIKVNPTQVKIVPTKKKFERAEKFVQSISEKSGLPKEMPIEKKVFIKSTRETFEQVKDLIQLSIDKMKGM